MIAALFVTLAVLVAPPARPAPSHTLAPNSPPKGCPAPAIAFYQYRTNVRNAIDERDVYSFGGGTMVRGGEYPRDGRQILHFWRTTKGYPRVAARAEVVQETHTLRALDGSVRKVGNVWCMFSVPEPIPARLFVEDKN
jgi:hypothetical protein